MAVDAFASERQFLSHIAPVWLALEPVERGTFYVSAALADQAGSEGIGPVRVAQPDRVGPAVLVASYQDHATARARGRPVVYLEHGAGQTYVTEGGQHPSYSGSDGHDGTVLFLSPSEAVADRWRARYPDVPAAAIGCPKLDAFHDASRWRPRSTSTTVAISFHSPVRLCPETFGAWSHFFGGLKAVCASLGAEGVKVLGHAHPRLWGRLGPRWETLGAEPVEDFAEVLCRTDLYCCDNSSTLPEAASCGIPLVWLNAPWFRPEVEHGGRFWNWPRGQVMCDSASELPTAVMRALEDPPDVRAAREAMVRSVYVATDGKAALRAVTAIRSVLCPAREHDLSKSDGTSGSRGCWRWAGRHDRD